MALDFPTNPTNGQVYDNYYYDSILGAWRSAGTKNGLSTRLSTLENTTVPGVLTRITTLEVTTIPAIATRTGNLETANSTTNKSGMVPVIPSSISVGSGSGSVNANGLVTFSGVSSISLNSVFSASYLNYRMVFNVANNSLATQLGLRFRTGTTDQSGNFYYQYWFISRLNGATQTNSGGPGTSYNLLSAGSAPSTAWFGEWSGDILTPFVTTNQTIANGLGLGSDGTSSYQIMSAVLFNVATSFDGITLLSTAGTFGGTVKFYGYN